MKISEIINNGKKLLLEGGIEENEALSSTRLLSEHCFSIPYRELFLNPDKDIKEDGREYIYYKECIEKRLAGSPIQYITGQTEFMGFNFYVDPSVLIPRPDTENLVEEVLKCGLSHMNILDLCTGSGCIIISLLKLGYDCTGIGTDISAQALDVARKNAKNLLVDVELIESDMFKGLKPMHQFDIIVSNPPYIPTKIIPSLDTIIKDREPYIALDGGEDGLFFYRIIAKHAKDFLNKEGKVFLEIGFDQGEAVSELLLENGFKDVKVIKDYASLDRIVCGRV